MPRRFSYQEPPASHSGDRPPTLLLPVGDIGALVVVASRPGGATGTLVIDPAGFGCRRLTAELGRAWVRHASAGSGRYGTAKEWRAAVVEFGRHVDAVCPTPPAMTTATITVELLHVYEAMLAATYPAASDTPAKRASQLFALLRSIESDNPGSVNAAVVVRLAERTARPNVRTGVSLADFGERERLRLIETARKSAFQTEQRIKVGRTLIAQADDVAERTGSPSWPALVAAASRRELTVAALKSEVPTRWSALDDDLRALLPATTNGRPRLGELVELAYRHVFPHPLDVMGHYVLLALDTGAAPECLKDLTVRDCHFDDGVVRLRLVKHRAHTIRHQRYSDEDRGQDDATDGEDREEFPARRFRDTGSVVRSLIDITDAARQAGQLSELFVAGIVHPGWEGVKIGPVPWDETPFKTWIVRSGLDQVGTRRRWRHTDDGLVETVEDLAALSAPFDLRRLRKSNRAHLATVHPNEFHRWGDNELETFQRHYTRSATVFQVHAGRLFATIADTLATEATKRRANVIAPSAQARLAAGDTELAEQLGIDPAMAARLADGARDVDGGIAGCINPTGGPFVEPGQLCDVARLGMCLRCPLAVITPRHIDGLVRFDDEHLEGLRLSLEPPAWAERGLPTRLLVRQALADLGHQHPGAT